MQRLATPLRDTPQAVAVVPEKVLEEQRATTVREALRNVSGITISAGEGGRQGDTFILRGFSGQTDVFRDGSRDLGWFTRDTFNLEGVEVFFGPSSVLFGRGSTGGAVNLVTKAPRKGSFADVSLTGGTAPQGRIEADVNHTLFDKVQVRVNAMGQAGGVQGRDTIEKNRAGLAPSFRLELGAHRPGRRLPLPARARRPRLRPAVLRGRAGLGQPGHGRAPRRLLRGRGLGQGRGGRPRGQLPACSTSWRRGARLSNALRWGRVDRFALPTAPRNLAPAMNPTSIGRQRFESETDHAGVINQTDLRFELVTAFLKHAANLGLELSWEKRTQGRYNLQVMGAMGTATNLPADLRNPEARPDLSSVERVFSSWSRGTQLAAAAYLSDQIKITRYLEVLGSLRLDSFGTEYQAINAMGETRASEPRPAGQLARRRGRRTRSTRPACTSWPGARRTHRRRPAPSRTPPPASIPSATWSTRWGPRPICWAIGWAWAAPPSASPRPTPGCRARIPMNGPPQILFGKQRVQGFNVGRDREPDRPPRSSSAATPSCTPGSAGTPTRTWSASACPARRRTAWPSGAPTRWWRSLVLGAGANFQAETVVNNPATRWPPSTRCPTSGASTPSPATPSPTSSCSSTSSNLTDALYYQEYSGSQAVPAEGRVVLMTARMRL